MEMRTLRARVAIILAVSTASLALSAIAPVRGQDANDRDDASARLERSVGALQALEEFNRRLGIANPDDDFLDPEQAFVLSTEIADGDTLVARWWIADGYYLYRKRFKFSPTGAPAVRVGEARFPKGETKHDEYFGESEVYYREAAIRVPVSAASAATGSGELSVNVRYQGCADAGLCYPPITKTVSFRLPVRATLGAAGDDGPATNLPEQDRIAQSIAGGHLGLIVLSFFGFGLLLAFTPCVLPMVPILSSIVVGQSGEPSAGRAFTLSLIFVLAMALTYTAAGIAAGLFGANLQVAFQDPWIMGAFCAVFVLLALSMFGFYELQIPTAWQARLAKWSNRQRGGSYVGVGVMGFLSALIVGPCVAAPLAGALIYIGQTGDAVLGGLALFAMSLGMGAPLLVVGTSAGKLLPKAGPWMDAVKAVFGVMLLAVAIYLLERVVPDWVTLLLCAALLIVCAIYMGALDGLAAGVSGWRRLWKGTGVMMMVYGILLMVGAAGGGGSLLQPLEGLGIAGGGPHRSLEFTRVKGSQGLDGALRAAARQGRPVMLDYYADWCVSCKEMEKFTFTDRKVQAALGDAVLLQADVTANDAEDRGLLERFGLHGPPAILFFDRGGRERRQFRVVGFKKAADFADIVRRATEPERGTRVSGPAPVSRLVAG